MLVFYIKKYRGLVIKGALALLLVDIFEILPPLLIMWLVDAISNRWDDQWVWILALSFFVVSCFQAIGRYGWRIYLLRTSVLAGHDLRLRFVEKLTGLPSSFFDKNRVGDLLALATNDTEAFRRAIGFGLVILIDAFFYITTIFAAMLWLNWKLTLIIVWPLIFVPIIVSKLDKIYHQRFLKVQESFSDLSSMAQEALMGIRVVKAFSREKVQINQFNQKGLEFQRDNIQLAKIQSIFGPLLDLVVTGGLVLLLFFGGKQVLVGTLTLGAFVAFQRYLLKLVWPIKAVGLAVTVFQRAITSSNRIKAVLDVDPEIKEPQTPLVPALWSGRAIGKIEIRDLNFSYSGDSSEFNLKNISLTLEPGERVAVMGRVGSGKTTLLSLLPRLYAVENGKIFLDGLDINHWGLANLRAQIGFVGQDIFLFSEKVFENVAFSMAEVLEESLLMAKVSQVAELSAVHQEMLSAPNGYDTLLGERGVNLSGGQKQRLTLARALFHEPPVLILDDVLSAVDTQTENKILEALKSRTPKSTEWISAHRISTIQHCDRVLVMEKGEIIQQGTVASLLRQKTGQFHRYYEQQRLREEIESYAKETKL